MWCTVTVHKQMLTTVTVQKQEWSDVTVSQNTPSKLGVIGPHWRVT